MAVSVKPDEEKPKGKKRGGRFGMAPRVLLFVLLAGIAAAVYRFGASGGKGLTYFLSIPSAQSTENVLPADEIEADTGLNTRFAAVSGGLAALSPDGLTLYDGDGHNRLFAQCALGDPVLRTAGAYALGFDRGGTSFVLTGDFSLICSGEAEGAVLGGGIGKNGWFTLVTQQSGYKAVVTVYDSKATPVYRWFSSERYVADAAVSPDGKRMAAACFGQKKGDFFSSILFFKLSSDQTLATNDIMESEALSVSYLEGGSLCAVLEDRLAFFDGNGKPSGEFSFGGEYLKDFSLSGKLAAVQLGHYPSGGETELSVAGTDGTVRAKMSLGDDARQISAAGDYVAVLFSDRLAVYTGELKKYAEYTGVGDAHKAVMREDGTVLLIGSRSVRILSP